MGRALTRFLGHGRFETEIGRHRIVTDHEGGGPTPTDLFLVSLPACVGFYVAEYCHRAGLDATGLEVELEYVREPRRVAEFGIVVRLPHAEVGARAEALRRVAEACYVHESIRTFGAIPIRLEDAAVQAA